MPSETSFHSELKSTLKNLAVAVLVEKLKKKDIDINVFALQYFKRKVSQIPGVEDLFSNETESIGNQLNLLNSSHALCESEFKVETKAISADLISYQETLETDIISEHESNSNVEAKEVATPIQVEMSVEDIDCSNNSFYAGLVTPTSTTARASNQLRTTDSTLEKSSSSLNGMITLKKNLPNQIINIQSFNRSDSGQSGNIEHSKDIDVNGTVADIDSGSDHDDDNSSEFHDGTKGQQCDCLPTFSWRIVNVCLTS